MDAPQTELPFEMTAAARQRFINHYCYADSPEFRWNDPNALPEGETLCFALVSRNSVTVERVKTRILTNALGFKYFSEHPNNTVVGWTYS
jgi:hypothetical protein